MNDVIMNRSPYPVFVHQLSQPRFDTLHDVLQQVLLHLRALVEAQVPHMDGAPHLRQRHKRGEVLLVRRLLKHQNTIMTYDAVLSNGDENKSDATHVN